MLFHHGQKSRGIIQADCYSPLQLPTIALVLSIVSILPFQVVPTTHPADLYRGGVLY